MRKQPGISLLIVFAIGFAIGLFLFGWGLTPVTWEDAAPNALSQQYQDNFVRAVADAYSFDNNAQKVQEALGSWGGADAACAAATRSTDPAEVQRLQAVASVVNGGVGCAGVTAITPPGSEAAQPAEEGGSSLASILFLGLLLIILIGAILFVLNRRNAMQDGGRSSYIEMPTAAPVSADLGMDTTPIASVDTTYVWGDDRFEYSFPIENQSQDFLGDCGIAISESIGTDTPRNVAAFEVWLFDKNDIRTRTKILMSDHAFYDEGIKAKLATKGTEQILAREHETIVLETVSLILNAEITMMEYGQDTNLPPNSYFDRLSIKFHVWSKEGDFEPPDIEGRVQEIRQVDVDDAFDF
ncbi:MAG: hypothetical protein IPM39_17985 [Chloroflexi bacterium]|nr:hypothetical protein [Chloroflexota bacterium]